MLLRVKMSVVHSATSGQRLHTIYWIDMKSKIKLAFVLSLAWLFSHLSIWTFRVLTSDRTWNEILGKWDAGWYEIIIHQGYEAQNFAFFPLYPMLIKYLGIALNITNTKFLGSFVSLFLFVCTLALMISFASSTRISQGRKTLLPQSHWSILALLMSPSSFILHTHHTESLFLFLSFVAFFLSHQKNWKGAAIFAGLCALTRNQGVLVAFCVALTPFFSKPYEHKKASMQFILSGIISALIFSLYPIYQYTKTGSFFAFLDAQQHWSHATSVLEYFRTFWFGNSQQSLRISGILHHIYYFLLIYLTKEIWKDNRVLALYCALSLAIMPLQGELVNAFRFGLVLFPLHFCLGNKLHSMRPPLRWIICLGFVVLNLVVAEAFSRGKWGY